MIWGQSTELWTVGSFRSLRITGVVLMLGKSMMWKSASFWFIMNIMSPFQMETRTDAIISILNLEWATGGAEWQRTYYRSPPTQRFHQKQPIAESRYPVLNYLHHTFFQYSVHYSLMCLSFQGPRVIGGPLPWFPNDGWEMGKGRVKVGAEDTDGLLLRSGILPHLPNPTGECFPPMAAWKL